MYTVLDVTIYYTGSTPPNQDAIVTTKKITWFFGSRSKPKASFVTGILGGVDPRCYHVDIYQRGTPWGQPLINGCFNEPNLYIGNGWKSPNIHPLEKLVGLGFQEWIFKPQSHPIVLCQAEGSHSTASRGFFRDEFGGGGAGWKTAPLGFGIECLDTELLGSWIFASRKPGGTVNGRNPKQPPGM